MLNTEDFTQRFRPVPHCDSKAHVSNSSSITSTSAETCHTYSVYTIQHPSTLMISRSDIGPAPHSDIKYTSTLGLPSLQFLAGKTPNCMCVCCPSSISDPLCVDTYRSYSTWLLVQHISFCCSQHIRIGSSYSTSFFSSTSTSAARTPS